MKYGHRRLPRARGKAWRAISGGGRTKYRRRR